MYTYTILDTHSHVAGGGQTEAHTVQKKNIDRAERAADIRLTNPKGHTPCDTLCGKEGGGITEARRRQQYEMPRKKNIGTGRGIPFIKGRGSTCLPATWILFRTFDPKSP